MSDNSTGITFPFEKIAISGGEMPDGLTGPEQRLFLGLRALYHQKRVGIITREVAVAEKKKLVHTYSRDVADSEVCNRLIACHTKINNSVWQLYAEFKRAPSMELANKIVRVFDGLEVVATCPPNV